MGPWVYNNAALASESRKAIMAMIHAIQEDRKLGPYELTVPLWSLGFCLDRRVIRRHARRLGVRFTCLGGKPRIYCLKLGPA